MKDLSSLKISDTTLRSDEKSDQDGLYLVCSCPVCNRCRFRPKLGQCDYGGPFHGYLILERG